MTRNAHSVFILKSSQKKGPHPVYPLCRFFELFDEISEMAADMSERLYLLTFYIHLRMIK